MRNFRILLCAVSLFSFVAQSDAATLYGSTAAGAPGRLHLIDQATGAVVQDIGPLNDAAGLNYGMTGLAFHPVTGVLYGSSANADEATRAKLVTINPSTAQVTVIGAFNAGNPGDRPSTMADIAFSAAGDLFGLGSVGGPQLYSINASTGQATQVGGSGLTSTTGGGLAISSAGEFFGTPTAGRFGTYNSATGAYTDIANPDKPVGGGYGALDFDGSVLYGLNVGSGSPPPTHLVTINQTTGAVTDLGASITSLDAIAFRPIPIPEPGTFILVLGAAGLLCCSRRALAQ